MVILKNQSAFINMAEFVYTPFTFDLFLHSGSKFEMTEVHEKDQVTLNNTTTNLRPGGQPSIIKKFPSIIDATTEFAKQNGYAAQHQRRTETGYSSGITIPQICNYLLKSYQVARTQNF